MREQKELKGKHAHAHTRNHFLPRVRARILSSSTLSPVSHAAVSLQHACVCTSLDSFDATAAASTTLEAVGGGGGSTSTTRTTAVPSSTRRTFSASHAGARALGVEGDAGEEPEKACQNALPRRCTSVCEAIVASAACCGVGIGVEPSWGEAGGVGYADATGA